MVSVSTSRCLGRKGKREATGWLGAGRWDDSRERCLLTVMQVLPLTEELDHGLVHAGMLCSEDASGQHESGEWQGVDKEDVRYYVAEIRGIIKCITNITNTGFGCCYCYSCGL